METTSKLIHPYGYVANVIINSPDVSFEAKGVYLYLNSKPDRWDFSAKRIAQDSTTSLYAVQKSLKELEDIGLLVREKQPSGRVIYHITDPASDHTISKSQNSPSQNRLSQKWLSQNRLVDTISKKEESKKEESKKEESKPIEKPNSKELPVSLGKTGLSRMKWLYCKLYSRAYGVEPRIMLNGKEGGVLKSLLKSYSEWQVSALMIEHFEIDDYGLDKACRPITWIGPRANQYVQSIDKDLEWNDPVQVKKYVSECITDLTKK